MEEPGSTQANGHLPSTTWQQRRIRQKRREQDLQCCRPQCNLLDAHPTIAAAQREEKFMRRSCEVRSGVGEVWPIPPPSLPPVPTMPEPQAAGSIVRVARRLSKPLTFIVAPNQRRYAGIPRDGISRICELTCRTSFDRFALLRAGWHVTVNRTGVDCVHIALHSKQAAASSGSAGIVSAFDAKCRSLH